MSDATDATGLPLWCETLWTLRERLSDARPAAQVEKSPAPGVRVYRGWRMPSIDECLDRCAQLSGYLEADLSEFEVNSTEYKRAWARSNVDKARANSKRQWEKADVRMRDDYRICLQLYASIYPGAPVPGYDTWRRKFKATWSEDRLICLARMNTWKLAADRGLRASIVIERLAA